MAFLAEFDMSSLAQGTILVCSFLNTFMSGFNGKIHFRTAYFRCIFFYSSKILYPLFSTVAFLMVNSLIFISGFFLMLIFWNGISKLIWSLVEINCEEHYNVVKNWSSLRVPLLYCYHFHLDIGEEYIYVCCILFYVEHFLFQMLFVVLMLSIYLTALFIFYFVIL